MRLEENAQRQFQRHKIGKEVMFKNFQDYLHFEITKLSSKHGTGQDWPSWLVLMDYVECFHEKMVQ